MRFFFLVVLVSWVLFSCKNKEIDKSKIVARVYDEYLSIDELKKSIPSYLSNEDSLAFVKNYINKWAIKNLMLKKAEFNISDEEVKAIDEQIEDFRKTLLIFKYEQMLISSKSDTNVSKIELDEYYNQHMPEFKLDETIVKCNFVRTDLNNKAYNKIKNLLWANKEEDKEKLEDLCYNEADTFFLADKWFNLKYINSLFPSVILNEESVFKYSKLYEAQDSIFKYIIYFTDYRLKKDQAPLSYIEPQLRSLIKNKKKLLLIKEVENNLFQSVINSGDFETY